MRAYTETDTDGKVYLIKWDEDKTDGKTRTLIYDQKKVLKLIN